MRFPHRRLALLAAASAAVLTAFVACEADDAASPGLVPDGGLQLDGATSDRTTPDGAGPDAPTSSNPSKVVQISLGRYHACARHESGAVSCWGYNIFGALGNGETTGSGVHNLPKRVSNLEDALQISAGEQRTCAVKATGNVVCWGLGDAGGADNNILVPTPVVASDAGAPFANAVEVDAKWHGSTCIRRANGTVACWAPNNNRGRVGDGTTDSRWFPSANVVGLTDAVQIARGDMHACARRTTGQIECWGMNTGGQVGNNSATGTIPSPELVSGVTDAVDLGAGENHACARFQSGGVRCWGLNGTGQLGDGTTSADRRAPVAVVGLTDAKQLDGGANHTCALRAGGTVVCWGSNTYGQLGDGTKTDRLTPTPVSGLTDVVQISVGYLDSCALRSNGQVLCWGPNDRGQHGDGTNTEHLTPSPVTL